MAQIWGKSKKWQTEKVFLSIIESEFVDKPTKATWLDSWDENSDYKYNKYKIQFIWGVSSSLGL